MGILDDAINSQDAKRSQRLSKEAQKTKIENNKIKEGTYRGIDLADGTARIQLDGEETATSGYKLITNAPLGDGDRVSIRPNGVGMPRADAKNVAPKITEEIKKVDLIFASLGYIGITTFNNVQSLFLESRTKLATGGLMEYLYTPKSLKFSAKGKFDATQNTRVPPNPIGTNYEANFVGDSNFVTYSFPTNAGSLFAEFAVFFPEEIWKTVIDSWIGYYTNESFSVIKFNDAPVEVEMALNGVTNLPTLTINKQTRNGVLYYSIAADCQITPEQSPVTFSFRFRKRVTNGDPLTWFSLG